MKELDSFTVERLEELSTKENIPEVAALARIALAAKRAEPEWYIVITSVGVWQSRYKTRSEAENHIKPWHKDYWIKELYTTPQLNSPEIPEGWKLVPIELTAEMAQAAREAHEGESYLPYSIYRAMLAAAPEKENG